MARAQGHRIFASFYPIIGWLTELGFGERRRRLIAGAEGRIVEIGAGTGLNFRHYGPEADVLATEPDPHMLGRAWKAARRARAKISLRRAAAESLPVPDGSADVVVSTLVLCSVQDPRAALAEARRVLRPGGKFLFLEHVRSQDPRLTSRQDRRDRLWARVAGGCHPNRDTWASIVAAGFEPEMVDREDLPGLKILRPAISGVARKPGDR